MPAVVATQQQAGLSVNSAVPLFTMGEYSVHPMELCSEDQIVSLFVKVSQRGNPVLQGRPVADLELLGRAMYRKTMLSRMGQVVLHKGKPVALSCNWDASAGGVWDGSGLTMPSSLSVHAAVGKACFASLPERSGSTFFAAFYGVLPPHPALLFGVLGLGSLFLAKEMGFEHTFQYTLVPTLLKRGTFGASHGGASWCIKFADVPTSDAAISQELTELGGTCNCAVMTLDYATSPEYVGVAAATVRMTPEAILAPCLASASQHAELLRGRQTAMITSRL